MPSGVGRYSTSLPLTPVESALLLGHQRAAVVDVRVLLPLPGCSLFFISTLSTPKSVGMLPYRHTTSNTGRLGTNGHVFAPNICK
jgi:hypothetical protein